MYCKNCGKQLKDQANFCPYCGAAQTSYSNTFELDARPSLPELDRNHYKALMLFACIGLILAFLPFHFIVLIISFLIGASIILVLLINRKKYLIKKRDLLYILSISNVAISLFWLLYIIVS